MTRHQYGGQRCSFHLSLRRETINLSDASASKYQSKSDKIEVVDCNWSVKCKTDVRISNVMVGLQKLKKTNWKEWSFKNWLKNNFISEICYWVGIQPHKIVILPTVLYVYTRKRISWSIFLIYPNFSIFFTVFEVAVLQEISATKFCMTLLFHYRSYM